MKEVYRLLCDTSCLLKSRGCEANEPLDAKGEDATNYYDCRHFTCLNGLRNARDALKRGEKAREIRVEGKPVKAIPFGSPQKPFGMTRRFVCPEEDFRGRIITTKIDGTRVISSQSVLRKAE